MRSFVSWLAASCFLVACGPPQLTLPQVSTTAKLAATRDGRDKVKVSLTWDVKTTACGTVTNLTGRIDNESGTVTAGSPAADGGCDFPTLQLAPKSSSSDRVVTFDDGRGTISMTVTTFEAPTASIVSTNHAVRVNDSVVWTFSGSGGDVGAWKIFYTPTSGGDPATWAEGTGPIMSVGAMVPSSAANTSGTVGLSWKSLAEVRACTNAKTCTIDVGDQAAYAISVSP